MQEFVVVGIAAEGSGRDGGPPADKAALSSTSVSTTKRSAFIGQQGLQLFGRQTGLLRLRRRTVQGARRPAGTPAAGARAYAAGGMR